MKSLRLQGKVALVTGAASERSIGWGIARALADEGADVVVNDVTRPDDLEKRALEIRSLGRRGLAINADVTKAEQVEAMVAQVVEKMGHLDILASNAGIIRWEHFLDITPGNLRAIINVNLMGTVNMCRAAAQQMIKQGNGGRIVITSSVQSELQYTNAPVYGGTKHAMQVFVGCLGLELAPYKITVNHIGPGWVKSELNDPAPGLQNPEDVKRQQAAIPLQRDGLPYEMGRAVVFFATEDGDYATGSYLKLDGGLALGKY